MNEKIYTIKEFCDYYKISPSTFYKMERHGIAPKLLRVGAKVLITAEAAKEWEKKNEK